MTGNERNFRIRASAVHNPQGALAAPATRPGTPPGRQGRESAGGLPPCRCPFSAHDVPAPPHGRSSTPQERHENAVEAGGRRAGGERRTRRTTRRESRRTSKEKRGEKREGTRWETPAESGELARAAQRRAGSVEFAVSRETAGSGRGEDALLSPPAAAAPPAASPTWSPRRPSRWPASPRRRTARSPAAHRPRRRHRPRRHRVPRR